MAGMTPMTGVTSMAGMTSMDSQRILSAKSDSENNHQRTYSEEFALWYAGLFIEKEVRNRMLNCFLHFIEYDPFHCAHQLSC